LYPLAQAGAVLQGLLEHRNIGKAVIDVRK
jgi:hypothetical protein